MIALFVIVSNRMNNFLIVCSVFIVITWIFWWYFFAKKCPKCKKYFGRKISLDSKSYDNSSDPEGSVSFSIIFDCDCKFCGHHWRI